MSVRGMVNCSVCGKELNRVLWNYGKKRKISGNALILRARCLDC